MSRNATIGKIGTTTRAQAVPPRGASPTVLNLSSQSLTIRENYHVTRDTARPHGPRIEGPLQRGTTTGAGASEDGEGRHVRRVARRDRESSRRDRGTSEPDRTDSRVVR